MLFRSMYNVGYQNFKAAGTLDAASFIEVFGFGFLAVLPKLLVSYGVVLEDIDNLAATGQVRVCGSVWSARSTDGAPIAAGTTVVVDRIEGVKLMVRTAKAPVGKA